MSEGAAGVEKQLIEFGEARCEGRFKETETTQGARENSEW
jgi:hypothetical protein